MALDGSCLDVADEAANATFFGYPGAARGEAAFPQVRVLGLVECGTHAVVAARLAPYGRSEQSLAAELLPAQLTADMLVLADRNFYGFKLWQSACASGAKLAWRVKSNLRLPVQQALPDGSYLSTVFDSADRAQCSGQTVRVIDYALQGLATPGQDRYRLVTNLLDPQSAPALELAALYHERWEIEGVFDEFKTHLRGHSTVLRSKTPQLVQQELWGLLLAHFRRAPAHGASRLAPRPRPGSLELHPRRARDQAQDAASRGRSPLSAWRRGAMRCSTRSRRAAASAVGGASTHAVSSAR